MCFAGEVRCMYGAGLSVWTWWDMLLRVATSIGTPGRGSVGGGGGSGIGSGAFPSSGIPGGWFQVVQ